MLGRIVILCQNILRGRRMVPHLGTGVHELTSPATTSPVEISCAQCGGVFEESSLIEVARYPLCSPCLQDLSRQASQSGRRRSTPPTRQRRLEKIVKGREIAGVCGGLAEYCNMDRGTFRAITIVGACITAIFPLFVIYLILAFVLPVRTDDD